LRNAKSHGSVDALSCIELLAKTEAVSINGIKSLAFAMSTAPHQAAPVSPAASESPVAAAPKRDYSECRLQIRQTNGQALVASFGAKVGQLLWLLFLVTVCENIRVGQPIGF
jgi:hypothetical protein